MKKIVLAVLIGFMLIGTVSAQGWGFRNWNAPVMEITTIEGTLQFQNGQFVINSNGTIYQAPAIRQLVGFVDAIRENARVTVNAYVFGNVLDIASVTAGGNTYDLYVQQPVSNIAQQGSWFYDCCYGTNFSHHNQRHAPIHRGRGRW